jgi:XTP/dITP diphosphohydrolase
VIIVATLNAHKLDEIRALPRARALDLRGLLDYEGVPEVVEDGVSCEENAMIKAVKYSLWLKREQGLTAPVIAEDSGLFIEALLGWPGVHSARIAPAASERIALVLARLQDALPRSAYFAAHTALAINGCPVGTWRGVVNGVITTEPRGSQGFGYDPVFEDPASGRTFAELTAAEKNMISHRTKAWELALAFAASQRFA